MTAPKTPEYTPNIPTRDMVFALWQTNFLANFGRLYLDMAKNHVPIDTPIIAGNHTNIQLIQQNSSQTTEATEISVYTKKVDGQTDQVWMKYGSGIEFQITAWQIYPITYLPNQTLFFTFLPGNLLAIFGQCTVNLPNTGAFTFELKPYVLRNVLSINLSNIPAAACSATLVKNDGGYFTGVTTSPFFGPQINTVFHYLVVGNL
jgi:hypothetical protein